MLCSGSARHHFLKNEKKERNSWLLFSQPDVGLRRGALDRYNTGKFLCQSRGSCPIDIQFVLLYKKKDFTLPFFLNHCFVYACLQISFQVSQTSYFPSIYLVNAYFLLSFLPCKLQEALEESEKNARWAPDTSTSNARGILSCRLYETSLNSMARDIFDEFLISVCVLWISASLKFTSVRVEEKIALNRNGCVSVNWIRIKRRNSWEEIAEARPKKSGTFCLGYLRTARNKQCLKWVTFRGNDMHSVKHFYKQSADCLLKMV